MANKRIRKKKAKRARERFEQALRSDFLAYIQNGRRRGFANRLASLFVPSSAGVGLIIAMQQQPGLARQAFVSTSKPVYVGEIPPRTDIPVIPKIEVSDGEQADPQEVDKALAVE